jgi:hypothetical protein
VLVGSSPQPICVAGRRARAALRLRHGRPRDARTRAPRRKRRRGPLGRRHHGRGWHRDPELDGERQRRTRGTPKSVSAEVLRPRNSHNEPPRARPGGVWRRRVPPAASQGMPLNRLGKPRGEPQAPRRGAVERRARAALGRGARVDRNERSRSDWGISADKIAKAERWGSDGDKDDGQSTRWLNAVSRLLEGGGTSLTISIEPRGEES